MEKQIEEMTNIIGNNTDSDTMWSDCEASAKAIYNAGYRKASDVAKEIFGKINKFIKAKRDAVDAISLYCDEEDEETYYNAKSEVYDIIGDFIEELQKKYESEDTK